MTEIIYKPNRQGRLSRRPESKRVREALGLPKGVGWNVPLPRDVLRSPALMVLPQYARQALDGIMLEYAEHGGITNGSLIVPYDDLVRRGMRKGSIKPGLVILEAVGLIAAQRDTRAGTMKKPSIYRLTFLGTPDGLNPTNEWRALKTVEEAETRKFNAIKRLEQERERVRKATAQRNSAPNLTRARAA